MRAGSSSARSCRSNNSSRSVSWGRFSTCPSLFSPSSWQVENLPHDRASPYSDSSARRSVRRCSSINSAATRRDAACFRASCRLLRKSSFSNSSTTGLRCSRCRQRVRVLAHVDSNQPGVLTARRALMGGTSLSTAATTRIVWASEFHRRSVTNTCAEAEGRVSGASRSDRDEEVTANGVLFFGNMASGTHSSDCRA